MSRTVFLQMLRAYRETFKNAYPKRDPFAVFKVLDECGSVEPPTQKAIHQATGVSQAEVSKIIGQAEANGWAERQTRMSDSTVTVRLTPEGHAVLARFNERCLEICQAAVAQKAPPATERKQTRGSRRRAAATPAELEALFGSAANGNKVEQGA